MLQGIADYSSVDEITHIHGGQLNVYSHVVYCSQTFSLYQGLIANQEFLKGKMLSLLTEKDTVL